MYDACESISTTSYCSPPPPAPSPSPPFGTPANKNTPPPSSQVHVPEISAPFPPRPDVGELEPKSDNDETDSPPLNSTEGHGEGVAELRHADDADQRDRAAGTGSSSNRTGCIDSTNPSPQDTTVKGNKIGSGHEKAQPVATPRRNDNADGAIVVVASGLCVGADKAGRDAGAVDVGAERRAQTVVQTERTDGADGRGAGSTTTPKRRARAKKRWAKIGTNREFLVKKIRRQVGDPAGLVLCCGV